MIEITPLPKDDGSCGYQGLHVSRKKEGHIQETLSLNTTQRTSQQVTCCLIIVWNPIAQLHKQHNFWQWSADISEISIDIICHNLSCTIIVAGQNPAGLCSKSP